jgi:hypothetical protein
MYIMVRLCSLGFSYQSEPLLMHVITPEIECTSATPFTPGFKGYRSFMQGASTAGHISPTDLRECSKCGFCVVLPDLSTNGGFYLAARMSQFNTIGRPVKEIVIGGVMPGFT